MSSLLRVTVCAAAAVVGALSTLGAQTLPPVRPLGPVVRVSPADLLGSVSTVRPLPGGKLLINDLVRRQLILLDSTFAKELIVADTTAATANAYGARPGGLIRYRGDSSLYIDPASLSMLVIDPAGGVSRVMAVPRPNDAQFMVGGPFGTPGFDSKGRIVYRGFTRPTMPAPSAQPGGAIVMPDQPDSAPILRVDLATRALDTAAFFKIPRTSAKMTQNDRGQISISMVMNPMPIVDDWTLLPDGTMAVVRGADYHIDWIAPDGARTSTPKIPFEWQRMTDESKVAFIDSAKTALTAARAAGTANGPGAVTMGGPGAGGPPGGGAVTMRFEMGGATGAAPPSGGPGASGPIESRLSPPSINMVSPTELPDYRPAFGAGATRADADGNLWIRTSKAPNAGSGPIYDIVNRSGALIDRVQLPFGRVIAGFGTGVVYMGVRDDKGARVEMARMR
jgi:hypothetical protein